MKRDTRIGLLLFFAITFVVVFFYAYQVLFTPNLALQGRDRWVYIRPTDNFKTVLAQMKRDSIVHDELSFAFLSKLVGYQDAVLPGSYLIPKNATNLRALRIMKGGHQTPVTITFNNIRLKRDFAEAVAEKQMFTADELMVLLNDPDTCKHYGFTPETIPAMFVPNTYEMYWHQSANTFMRKMHKQYEKFWTKERRAKAKKLGMTPVEVVTLASIVEEETKAVDEMPRVAGVYKNRLDQDMRLQADPTVIFALADFTIRRLLTPQTQFNHPYNTYVNKGLPPGPIRFPSPTAIDAVLNMEKHKYIYFCARPELDGRHNFSEDYAGHLKNRDAYVKGLDARGIKR